MKVKTTVFIVLLFAMASISPVYGSAEIDSEGFDSNDLEFNELQLIIGADNRIKVNPNYSLYSYVVMLDIGRDYNGDGSIDNWALGTGFMEGPDCTVTAAHCFWSSQHGWAQQVRTHKNQTGSTKNSPYYYPATWLCPTPFANNGDSNYDWCVVTMQTNLGDMTGWFGKYYTSGSLNNTSVSVSGYPDDSAHWYSQYKATGSITGTTPYLIHHNVDTTGGQSGAPIYKANGQAIGIHTHGVGSSSYNKGVRFTKPLYDILQKKYEEGMQKYH